MSAARDHADGFTLGLHDGAVPRYVARLGLEPDQLSPRTRGLDALQGAAADQVALVQLHGPTQARFVWIDRLVHVFAPQTQRRPEPGCISSPQTVRQHAG